MSSEVSVSSRIVTRFTSNASAVGGVCKGEGHTINSQSPVMPPVNCEIALLFLCYFCYFPVFPLFFVFLCVILCYFSVMTRVHPFPTIFETLFLKFLFQFQ